jgi:hypothetical protein
MISSSTTHPLLDAGLPWTRPYSTHIHNPVRQTVQATVYRLPSAHTDETKVPSHAINKPHRIIVLFKATWGLVYQRTAILVDIPPSWSAIFNEGSHYGQVIALPVPCTPAVDPKTTVPGFYQTLCIRWCHKIKSSCICASHSPPAGSSAEGSWYLTPVILHRRRFRSQPCPEQYTQGAFCVGNLRQTLSKTHSPVVLDSIQIDMRILGSVCFGREYKKQTGEHSPPPYLPSNSSKAYQTLQFPLNFSP